MVNKIFKDQIDQNMEVYINDMLVKSQASTNHIDDLRETFTTLYKYQMKLNPAKYAFGITSRKFLEFMVLHLDIETNLEKIRVKEMGPHRSKKVQCLTGRIAVSTSLFYSQSDASPSLRSWVVQELPIDWKMQDNLWRAQGLS